VGSEQEERGLEGQRGQRKVGHDMMLGGEGKERLCLVMVEILDKQEIRRCLNDLRKNFGSQRTDPLTLASHSLCLVGYLLDYCTSLGATKTLHYIRNLNSVKLFSY
jgi:hypothetical protein